MTTRSSFAATETKTISSSNGITDSDAVNDHVLDRLVDDGNPS